MHDNFTVVGNVVGKYALHIHMCIGIGIKEQKLLMHM